jgi:DNA mismatch endonuclease (patch repair protein)
MSRRYSADSWATSLALSESAQTSFTALMAVAKRTAPELAVESALRLSGCKFVSSRGKRLIHGADYIVHELKAMIWVDGCYWHACEFGGPESVRGTSAVVIRERDRRNRDEAQLAGWNTLRIWECNPIAPVVTSFIGGIRRSSGNKL